MTRSRPHVTTLVALLHTVCPGPASAHRGSIVAQIPWFVPVSVLQFCPTGHVWLSAHVPLLQMRPTFCALPLHASVPGEEHGQPRVATAPVPLPVQVWWSPLASGWSAVTWSCSAKASDGSSVDASRGLSVDASLPVRPASEAHAGRNDIETAAKARPTWSRAPSVMPITLRVRSWSVERPCAAASPTSPG